MSRRDKNQRYFGFAACVLAGVIMLGCWSSDSLFITLTATPAPTPTRQSTVFESLYHVGDRLEIAGQGIGAVYLTHNPEPATRRNRVPNATCYANTTVEISDVEVIDGVTYYRISCNNTPGWVVESSLRPAEGN
jgi:hypothetical protein